VNFPEVWASRQLLTKKSRKSIIQKLGLALNCWQKKYKVNYVEVWASSNLLAKEIQCELSRCVGLPSTSEEENTK